MKITKTIKDNTTTYYYNNIKKYEHLKNSEGFECWKEYKDGNEVYYKNSNGYERWREYKNGNEVYYKNSEGFECWREYKDGNEVHFKDSDGLERWREYKNGNEVHFKDSNGNERWSEYKDGNEVHFKDSNGNEWWSDDNPENPKNKEITEEDIKPFEFSNKIIIMKNKTLREENGVDTLSQCPHCISMTKTTIDGICGKCGGHKAKIGSGIPLNNSKLRERLEDLKCINGAMYFGSVKDDTCNCKISCVNSQTFEHALDELLTFIEKEQARVLEEEIIRLEGEKKNPTTAPIKKKLGRPFKYPIGSIRTVYLTNDIYNQCLQAQIDHHKETLSKNIKEK